MWLKVLTGIFIICLLAAIYCIYRLNLYAPPKPKRDDKLAETNLPNWSQQKELASGEIEVFLEGISLPRCLLEPRVYNQQLELLRFPNHKRYGDWRYESNEELILGPLQQPLKAFLDNLKTKGCSLQGLEEDFLRELVHRIAIRNYKDHLGRWGDFIQEGMDIQSAGRRFFELREGDGGHEPAPYFAESLSNYYSEPMIFKAAIGSNHGSFGQAVGTLDFLQRYFQIKGVAAAPVPIKEFNEILEEAFRQYRPSIDADGI